MKTGKFKLTKNGITLGKIFITTGRIELPNHKLATIIYTPEGEIPSLDGLDEITWIYIETINDLDVCNDLIDKAGYDGEDIVINS